MLCTAPRELKLTITALNVESAVPLLSSGQLPEVARALGDPDVLRLEELGVRASDAALVERLSSALEGGVCGVSLNRDLRNAKFRGGRMYGVATFVKRALSPRFETFPWDKEGRVVVALLDAPRLAIANVYAVNGTDRPYFDHALGLVSGDRHAFKRRFIEALGSDMRAIRDRGYRLVLTGDWNTSREAIDTHPRLRAEEPHALARQRFNDEFLPGLDVVDVFRQRHPEARAYSWFNRSARKLDAARVDFTLVSRSLVDEVETVGVHADPALRFGSDHAPHWVSLRTR